jgi:hypothetical protein
MLNSLEVKSDRSVKIGFLIVVLIHYHIYKTILQWTLVWIFSEGENDCKYKLLTKSDVDFHNIMIADLFNCICVNGLCIYYCCD